MKRSKEVAIYDHIEVVVKDGRFASETRPMEVRVMTRAEGYALVRVKGGMPFAVSESSLRPIAAAESRQGGETP